MPSSYFIQFLLSIPIVLAVIELTPVDAFDNPCNDGWIDTSFLTDTDTLIEIEAKNLEDTVPCIKTNPETSENASERCTSIQRVTTDCHFSQASCRAAEPSQFKDYVAIYVDPCSSAAKLTKENAAVITSIAKASIQLSRANTAVTSLQARFTAKKRIHDTRLKIFEHSVETLNNAKWERIRASMKISQTESEIPIYQDEYIEATAQARNPTIPYKSRTKYIWAYVRGSTNEETITDYDRALARAATDKAKWHNQLMSAKSNLAKQKTTYNLKDRLFNLAESNMKRTEEAFQKAKLDMETAESELHEAQSTREVAQNLYENAVQHSKLTSKKSSADHKPKYQSYG